jgi:hypothetical protein
MREMSDLVEWTEKAAMATSIMGFEIIGYMLIKAKVAYVRTLIMYDTLVLSKQPEVAQQWSKINSAEDLKNTLDFIKLSMEKQAQGSMPGGDEGIKAMLELHILSLKVAVRDAIRLKARSKDQQQVEMLRDELARADSILTELRSSPMLVRVQIPLPANLLVVQGRTLPDVEEFTRTLRSANKGTLRQLRDDVLTVSERLKKWHGFKSLFNTQDTLRFDQAFEISRVQFSALSQMQKSAGF